MSKEIVAKAGQGLKHELKMTPKYFLRKLSYLTELRHPPEQRQKIATEKDTILRNFKLYFPQYGKDRRVVDSVMTWVYRDRLDEPRLWTMYGRYLIDNMKLYDLKSLVHISNMVVKHEIPYGLFHCISQRFLTEDISVLTTQEVAMICKQAQNEEVLRKATGENRVQVANDVDLYFFTSAFLVFAEKFPDVMEMLKGELEKRVQKVGNVQTLCHVLRVYGDFGVDLPDSVVKSFQTAICSEEIQFNQMELNEILVTIRSAHYFDRVSTQFWVDFEGKLLKNMQKYHASWLLATIARHGFPSAKIMEAAIPRWIANVEKFQSKEIFREGFCALTKYQTVDEQTKEWCVSQAVVFRQLFTAFDVATIMRAIVAPGWYSPTLWKLLLDRFFSPVLSAPKDIDKAMVYFALKSLEIDEVEIPIINPILNEKRELFREVFEQTNFHTNVSRMHREVAREMRRLGLEYREFEKVAKIYAPDFVVGREKTVILCQEWPFHVTAHTGRLSVSTQMMLRHFNKSGYSVIIVANCSDLATHLKAVLARAQAAKHPTNLQIV